MNMTALLSCFIRYYHTKNSNIKIYNDIYAEKILSEEEIKNISDSLISGIKYFNPNYEGNNPLKWIINNEIGSVVIARSIFNEHHLKNEIKLGLKQYLILGSGYDMSAYKFNIKTIEVDNSDVIDDKIKRINNASINNNLVTYIKGDLNNLKLNIDYDKTFCSLLGISYYLTKKEFSNLINYLSNIIPIGSTILFDYPDNLDDKIVELANASFNPMKSHYSYQDILEIANDSNMLIYEHLDNKDIDDLYFYNYNTLNPNNKIYAPKNIKYCLLVKK